MKFVSAILLLVLVTAWAKPTPDSSEDSTQEIEQFFPLMNEVEKPVNAFLKPNEIPEEVQDEIKLYSVAPPAEEFAEFFPFLAPDSSEDSTQEADVEIPAMKEAEETFNVFSNPEELPEEGMDEMEHPFGMFSNPEELPEEGMDEMEHPFGMFSSSEESSEEIPGMDEIEHPLDFAENFPEEGVDEAEEMCGWICQFLRSFFAALKPM